MSERNRNIARSALSLRPAPSSRPAVGLAALAFRKYAPALHRYIERRMRRPGSALDLTQDIFERFLQIKDADAVRNPQAYLYGIASHVVREALFCEDRSLVTYDSDAAEEAGGRLDQALPDDLAERLSLQQDLRRALAALPAMHRAVLLLVKRDGLTYEEAAQKTRLTLGTVTNYVFEARARVKMLLKDREE
jgi:RNA polymerase sigma-70 factor (ECF subfamily)